MLFIGVYSFSTLFRFRRCTEYTVSLLIRLSLALILNIQYTIYVDTIPFLLPFYEHMKWIAIDVALCHLSQLHPDLSRPINILQLENIVHKFPSITIRLVEIPEHKNMFIIGTVWVIWMDVCPSFDGIQWTNILQYYMILLPR